MSAHNLTTVTGADFDSAGRLIVSQGKITDYGNFNETKLHHVDVSSGLSCKLVTVPVEISDLTYVSNKDNCQAKTICTPVALPDVTLSPASDPMTLTEGEELSFDISLSHSYTSALVLQFKILDATSNATGVTLPKQTVKILANKQDATVTIKSQDNDDSFTLVASFALNPDVIVAEREVRVLDNDFFNCNGADKVVVSALPWSNGTFCGELEIHCGGVTPYTVHGRASRISFPHGSATLSWETTDGSGGSTEVIQKTYYIHEFDPSVFKRLKSVRFKGSGKKAPNCHLASYGRVSASNVDGSISIGGTNEFTCKSVFNATLCPGDSSANRPPYLLQVKSVRTRKRLTPQLFRKQ